MSTTKRDEDHIPLTVPQVAARLSLDVSRVRALCASGRIGHKVGRQWLISSEDVDRVRDELSEDSRSPFFAEHEQKRRLK